MRLEEKYLKGGVIYERDPKGCIIRFGHRPALRFDGSAAHRLRGCP
jgi:hypothetical protein